MISNGCVINLNNGDSVGIMDVASFSLARKYLSNSSFPNRHVDMVASINRPSKLNLFRRFLPRIIVGVATCHTHTPSFPTIREGFDRENPDFQQFAKVFTRESFPLYGIF